MAAIKPHQCFTREVLVAWDVAQSSLKGKKIHSRPKSEPPKAVGSAETPGCQK